MGLASVVGAKTCSKMAGFALESPDAWEAVEDRLGLKLSSKDGAFIDFSVEDTKLSLDEFAAGYIKDYQRGLNQAKLGPTRKCTVNGLRIVRAEGIAVTSQSVPIHFTVGVYGNGPHLLKFWAVCRSDRYAAQKTNLTNILGSLRPQS